MANGYVRQSSGAIVALAKLTSAAHNNEYNALQTAFDSVAGHNHNPAVTGAGAAIDLTLSVTGVLPLANGGTGGLLDIAHGGTGSATAAAARTALGISTIGNTGALTDGTGTLLTTHGGTGQTTLAAHGVVIGNAASAVNVTATGTTGQVLTSNGASADPTWQPTAVNNGGAETITGATLVTNGVNLSTTASWTANNATLTVVSQALHVAATSGNGGANQAITCVIGDTYTFQFDVAAISGGTAAYGIGTVANTNDIVSGSRGTTGTAIQLSFVATQTTHYVNLQQVTSGQSADYNNISVNLTQHLLTATSKRVLNVTPSPFPITLIAPDATTLQTGMPIFYIKNLAGGYAVFYRDKSSNFLFGIPGGESSIVTLGDSSTANGQWLRESTSEIAGKVGAASQWKSGTAQGFHDMLMLDSTHVLIAYSTSLSATSLNIQCLALNADGTVSSSGNILNFTANSTNTLSYFRLIKLSATQAVLVVTDTTVTQVLLQAVNISGTTTSLPAAFTTIGSAVNSGVAGAAFSPTHFFVVYKQSSTTTVHVADYTIVTATGVITIGTDTDSTLANVSFGANNSATCPTSANGYWAQAGAGSGNIAVEQFPNTLLALGEGSSVGTVTGAWVESISSTGLIFVNDSNTPFAMIISMYTGVGGTVLLVGQLAIMTGATCKVLRVKKISANRLAILHTQGNGVWLRTVSYNELNGDLQEIGRQQYLFTATATAVDWTISSMDVISTGKLLVSSCSWAGATTNSFAQIEVPL